MNFENRKSITEQMQERAERIWNDYAFIKDNAFNSEDILEVTGFSDLIRNLCNREHVDDDSHECNLECDHQESCCATCGTVCQQCIEDNEERIKNQLPHTATE